MKKWGISELLLLGEDSKVTDTWASAGKTSIVFGRDAGEFRVDVNLKNTDFAGTIDGEHAVMNYSDGSCAEICMLLSTVVLTGCSQGSSSIIGLHREPERI